MDPKRIGVIYFGDSSHIYIYDNYDLNGFYPDPGEDAFQCFIQYLMALSTDLLQLKSGNRRYLIRKSKILFIKEYPED